MNKNKQEITFFLKIPDIPETRYAQNTLPIHQVVLSLLLLTGSPAEWEGGTSCEPLPEPAEPDGAHGCIPTQQLQQQWAFPLQFPLFLFALLLLRLAGLPSRFWGPRWNELGFLSPSYKEYVAPPTRCTLQLGPLRGAPEGGGQSPHKAFSTRNRGTNTFALNPSNSPPPPPPPPPL